MGARHPDQRGSWSVRALGVGTAGPRQLRLVPAAGRLALGCSASLRALRPGEGVGGRAEGERPEAVLELDGRFTAGEEWNGLSERSGSLL